MSSKIVRLAERVDALASRRRVRLILKIAPKEGRSGPPLFEYSTEQLHRILIDAGVLTLADFRPDPQR